MAKTDAPWATVPIIMGPWEVTYSHGPMGGSPIYGHGPMGGHLPMAIAPWGGHLPMAMGPWGGHLSMAMAPLGSPTYGHGPIGTGPHGGVTYLWPWPHGGHLPMAMGPWVLDPLLIKSVELSFGKNRCPLGHSAYGHGPMGGHLWPQAHGAYLLPWAPGGSPMGK